MTRRGDRTHARIERGGTAVASGLDRTLEQCGGDHARDLLVAAVEIEVDHAPAAEIEHHRGDDLAVGDRAPGDVDPVAPEPVRAEPGERRSVERAGLDDFEMIRGRHAL